MTAAKTLVARLRRQHPTPMEMEAADAIEELTAVLHRVDAHFADTDAPLGIRARALLTKYGAPNG